MNMRKRNIVIGLIIGLISISMLASGCSIGNQSAKGHSHHNKTKVEKSRDKRIKEYFDSKENPKTSNVKINGNTVSVTFSYGSSYNQRPDPVEDGDSQYASSLCGTFKGICRKFSVDQSDLKFFNEDGNGNENWEAYAEANVFKIVYQRDVCYQENMNTGRIVDIHDPLGSLRSDDSSSYSSNDSSSNSSSYPSNGSSSNSSSYSSNDSSSDNSSYDSEGYDGDYYKGVYDADHDGYADGDGRPIE